MQLRNAVHRMHGIKLFIFINLSHFNLQRMKIIEQEGTDFKYEVSYRVVGAAKFTQRNVTNSTYSLRIRTTRFTQYEVCVRAYNNKGPSVKLPNCIKAYSYQASKYSIFSVANRMIRKDSLEYRIIAPPP